MKKPRQKTFGTPMASGKDERSGSMPRWIEGCTLRVYPAGSTTITLGKGERRTRHIKYESQQSWLS